MEVKEYKKNGIAVLEIIDDGIVLSDIQDLLDIISDYSVKKIVLKKENIVDDFFDLSTGLAGEILQKASNYRICIGIIGDFEHVESKALRDFIYESNQERKIVFKPTLLDILKIFMKP